MKNTISGTGVIALILLLASCQKNISSPNPNLVSTNIFGFTDSSQLIKSITYHNQDSSWSQYFFYDTANRKIIVSLQPVTTVGGDYSDGQEFSYDGFGMLIHITGKFSGPNYSFFTSADFFYDNQHVLDSVNTVMPGLNRAEGFTKTIVSGGYLLSELYTSPAANGFTDSNYTASLIDDSGRLAAYYTVYNNTEPGDPQNTSPNGDTYFYFTDSVIYDAATRRNKPAYLTRRRARSPSLSFQLLKRSSHPIFRREFFFLFPSCTTKQKYRNCPSVSHCHRRCWSGREDFDRRPPAHDLTGVFEPGEMRENSSGTKTPVRSIM